MEMVSVFFENGGLLTYSLVSQIFEFGFGTRVRSLPDALLQITKQLKILTLFKGFLTQKGEYPFQRVKNLFWL
jgi:hypothetical protein